MNFTCHAESNANKQNLLILPITIEFRTFEVWPSPKVHYTIQ